MQHEILDFHSIEKCYEKTQTNFKELEHDQNLCFQFNTTLWQPFIDILLSNREHRFSMMFPTVR